MKVKVSKKQMLQALSVGGSMAGKGKSLPILNCVKVTVSGLSIIVSSYDGQNSITKRSSVLESEQDICFCVDCKDLVSLLKSIKDEDVTMDIDSKGLSMKVIHKKGKQKLPLESPEEYPQPKREDISNAVSISSAEVYEVVNTGKSFVQSNDLHPQMAGIYFSFNDNKLDVASTDGFTLFSDTLLLDKAVDTGLDATLNINAINPLLEMLSNAGEVNIGIGESTMCFRTEDAMLVSLKPEYKYPNYKVIIPTEYKVELSLGKNDLLDSLSRVMLTANKKSLLVKISTEGAMLNIVSEDLDFSKKSSESVMCNKAGGDIDVGLKGSLLSTCLNQVTTDSVKIFFIEKTRPVILKDDNFPNRTVLIMPMAL